MVDSKERIESRLPIGDPASSMSSERVKASGKYGGLGSQVDEGGWESHGSEYRGERSRSGWSSSGSREVDRYGSWPRQMAEDYDDYLGESGTDHKAVRSTGSRTRVPPEEEDYVPPKRRRRSPLP
jgi:hypothetical protein